VIRGEWQKSATARLWREEEERAARDRDMVEALAAKLKGR
jgi:hypothetical protein